MGNIHRNLLPLNRKLPVQEALLFGFGCATISFGYKKQPLVYLARPG